MYNDIEALEHFLGNLDVNRINNFDPKTLNLTLYIYTFLKHNLINIT